SSFLSLFFPYTTLFRSVEAFCVVVFEFCLRNKRFRRCARQSLLYVRVKRCAKQGVTMVTALTQGELMKAEPLLAKVAQQGSRRRDRKSTRLNSSHVKIS